jgi:hypothetical protein
MPANWLPESLMERLFKLAAPDIAPEGKKVFVELSPEMVEEWHKI